MRRDGEHRPFVSVVVPARNAASTLPDCLLALRAQTWPRDRYEVVVVDDGSTDSTAAIAEKFRVRTLRIAPSGPAVARNRGVEASHGEIIAFTDADCAPDPTWLAELVGPLSGPDVVATKGAYRTEQRSLTARFVQAEYESRYRRMAKFGTIDFVDTYSAAYRRSALEAVGGFDESFPKPSVEDQELSFRLAGTGARMIFCPRAIVAHRHAADPIAYLRKKAKIGFWKTRVLARFPGKVVTDTHTPSTLKVEMLLMAAFLLSLPVSLWMFSWWLTSVPVLLFAAVITPFWMRSLVSDPVLGLVAPIFLAGRALALGVGTVAGLMSGQCRSREPRTGLSPRREEDRVPQHV